MFPSGVRNQLFQKFEVSNISDTLGVTLDRTIYKPVQTYQAHVYPEGMLLNLYPQRTSLSYLQEYNRG